MCCSCLAHVEPVNLTAEQYNLLTGFAEMALRELERDHHAALTQRRHEHMLRTANCFKSGVLLCDVAEPSWPILFANAAWTGLTGMQACKSPQDPRPPNPPSLSGRSCNGTALSHLLKELRDDAGHALFTLTLLVTDSALTDLRASVVREAYLLSASAVTLTFGIRR